MDEETTHDEEHHDEEHSSPSPPQPQPAVQQYEEPVIEPVISRKESAF